jgi:hypothetical protein
LLDEHQQGEQVATRDRPVARSYPLLHRLFEAGGNIVGQWPSYSATGETLANALWRAGRHGNEAQVPGNRARLL